METVTGPRLLRLGGTPAAWRSAGGSGWRSLPGRTTRGSAASGFGDADALLAGAGLAEGAGVRLEAMGRWTFRAVEEA